MQGLDNDTSRYINDYSSFQFGPDMFEGNYADAHHSMSAPSIVHHHEFPFEHAHRVSAPNPGCGFGDFESLRPPISFDAYSCSETNSTLGPSVNSSLKIPDQKDDLYYKVGENQSSSSRSNQSSTGSKRKKNNQNLSSEEKRRITLEKNRQAGKFFLAQIQASRCRKKRKFLLQDLERHAQDATILNHTLTLRVQELETQLQMANEELRLLKKSCHCNSL